MSKIEVDFDRFAKLVKGKLKDSEDGLNIIEIDSLKTFKKFIKDVQSCRVQSFDVETTGLDPRADGAAINTFQLATKNAQWILPLEISWSWNKGNYDLQKKMLKIIARSLKGKIVSAQYGKFDNLWLMVIYKVRINLIFDTGVASHILDENTPNKLKYNARVFLGAPDYDISTKEKQGIGVTPEQFREYGGKDVYYTRQLTFLFRKMLKDTEGLYELFMKLMMRAARALEIIQFNGLYINKKRFRKVKKHLDDAMANVLSELNKHTKDKDINWNSPSQVGKFLFMDLKLNPLDVTPKGQPSTSESVLKRLAHVHKVPELILEYREYAKQLSTYIDGWRDMMHGDYLYLDLNLTGTVTGRLSSRLHQVPRNPLIRSLIDAPNGWTFFSADYSQIELRIAAMLAGDIAMLEIFKHGGDIHRATAAEVLGVHPDEVTKEQRKMAKAINFGLIYGMGWYKLVIYARDKYGVSISDAEAQRFRNRFFGKYSDFPKWHMRQRRVVHTTGQVRNPIGRIRRLPGIMSSDRDMIAKAERDAINSPVQAFGTDLKLMALVEISEKIPRKDLKLCGEQHDSILGRVRTSKLDIILPQVRKIMVHPELLDEFHVKIPVPILVDIEVGPWGSGELYLNE